MQYFFQLGHEPEISAAELAAVFSQPLKIINNQYALLETTAELNATKLINQLGGTIKIGRGLQTSDYGLQQTIIKYLNNVFPNGKIEFSLNDAKLAIETKKELKALKRPVRYIEIKNTATILHNKLVEKKSDLTIVDNQLFYTVAIQPFEEMSERDYGRPGADSHSGMLPPKLAKIMINLAVFAIPPLSKGGRGDIGQLVILDPFCGSGTILTEAAVMGYTNLIGSDNSPKAIADTEKNLDWIIKNYQLPITNYRLLITDATKLSNHLKPESITCIVTEPYLGRPLHGNESEIFIKKQITELKTLYLNAFKEFYKILKPGGIVVFVIPRFKFKSEWIKIEIEKEIEKIGFELSPFTVQTHCYASLQYHRPNQHLAREIWRFKKIP